MNWDTVYVGLLMSFLTTDDIVQFAEEQFCAEPDAEPPAEVSEIAFRTNLDGDAVLERLEQLISPDDPRDVSWGTSIELDKCAEPWRREARKWRALLLKEELEKASSSYDRMHAVEFVWETFMRPEDMRDVTLFGNVGRPRRRRRWFGGGRKALLADAVDFLNAELEALRDRETSGPAPSAFRSE